jgi:hypothetical protein
MGVGEIPASLSGPDAVSPSGDTIPSWRALWESPIHCTLHTGENPRTGLVRAAARVFLLEGVVWYGALRITWSMVEKTEGATIAGHHCFVTSPLLSFLFLGHVFAVAPTFFWFRTIVLVWLLYLYSGAKAYFEEEVTCKRFKNIYLYSAREILL